MYCKKRKKISIISYSRCIHQSPSTKERTLFSCSHFVFILQNFDFKNSWCNCGWCTPVPAWTTLVVTVDSCWGVWKRIHPLSVQRCRFITWVDKVYTLLQAYITSYQDKMEYWPEWFVIVFALLWKLLYP